MEVSFWFSHWAEVLQNLGIITGLFFSAYTAWKDERARKITNSIAITEHYRQIWKEAYDRPQLTRVLDKDPDLNKAPVSEEERLFVAALILHLSTVYKAMKFGMLVNYEGLGKDVKEFFNLPIPNKIWTEMKPFQDRKFVEFVERTSR